MVAQRFAVPFCMLSYGKDLARPAVSTFRHAIPRQNPLSLLYDCLEIPLTNPQARPEPNMTHSRHYTALNITIFISQHLQDWQFLEI